jgi:hypothetical protein
MPRLKHPTPRRHRSLIASLEETRVASPPTLKLVATLAKKEAIPKHATTPKKETTTKKSPKP